jgi:hypothetical protein
LPIVAVVSGFIGGFYSARYRPIGKEPIVFPIISSSLFMLLAAGLIMMQPELFRAGQLGNMSVLQLLGLAVVAFGATASVVFLLMARVKRENGFLSEVVHRRVMWLARLAVALCLVLFLMTESIVTFLILAFAAIPFAMISGGHQPYKLAKQVGATVFDIWAIVLFVFGLVSLMPAISVFAILLWRSASHKDLMKHLKKLL